MAREKVMVERVAVDALVPYARNARTHPEAQIAQLAASIREFGFTAPVLIDGDLGIVAGHGRVLAARRLGMETVPCIRLSHLTATQRRAYILADNRLAERAGWDADLVALELADLKAADFDVTPFGFGFDEPTLRGSQATAPEMGGMEYRIVVECRDEHQQGELLQRFESEGLQCRPLIS